MRILIILFLLNISSVFPADIPKLKEFFSDNFNNFYRPRLCGQNIAHFLREAKKLKIDLSNSYVLNVDGQSFLETSGFFSRNKLNEREMLGYFHVILVADDLVFDFDLKKPLVLDIRDYVRLQFTPPHEPTMVFGIDYSRRNPKSWDLTAFNTQEYMHGEEVILWKKRMGKYVNMSEIYKIDRKQIIERNLAIPCDKYLKK